MGRRAGFAVVCFAIGSVASGLCAAATPEPQVVRLHVAGGVLRAFVAPGHGADLAGLEVRHDGRWTELLYRGMNYQATDGWTGKAPILWPAVGRNFPGGHSNALGWIVNGQVHPMPLHGFARDEAWSIVRRGHCAGSVFLILELGNNQRTRDMYPFGFTLTTEYRLWGNSLYIRQAVHARRANVEPMPFSIGNHITFNVPLLPGDDPAGTSISTPATRQVITDSSGRPTGRIVTVSYASPRLLYSFTPKVPISLAGYAPGQEWARLQDRSGFAITVAHSEDRRPGGIPVMFNLWGDASQGYFAPEPWVGKQNSLVTGDGTIVLQPGATFRWTIEVSAAPSATASRTAGSAPTCLK